MAMKSAFKVLYNQMLPSCFILIVPATVYLPNDESAILCCMKIQEASPDNI